MQRADSLPGRRVAACVAGLLSILPLASHAACEASSGPNTAALVELYTSEGCSSCPPADQRLGQLAGSLDAGADFVAIALHVDYWDYIGWRDVYASPAFGDRQQWLVTANHETTVYTPRFFASGHASRADDGLLRQQVRLINAEPAAGSIRLAASLQGRDALVVRVDASVDAAKEATVLYLAVTESGIINAVERGENTGRTLRHDYLVRSWVGPLPLGDGRIEVQRGISLAKDWKRDRLEMVAFLQHPAGGHVPQALRAMQCAAS